MASSMNLEVCDYITRSTSSFDSSLVCRNMYSKIYIFNIIRFYIYTHGITILNIYIIIINNIYKYIDRYSCI